MAARMTMADYLNEVRHAVDSLMPLLWNERSRLQEVGTRLERLERTIGAEYGAAEWIMLNAEDADDVMLATLRQQETYWGPDRDRHYTQAEHDKLEAQVAARRFSVDSLAGSIIQFAKQGLSMVHGGKPSPPTGRAVGEQRLSDIVWAARNQALHWEEQDFSAAVQGVFTKLAAENPAFANYTSRNVALDVLHYLGWHSVATFEEDMNSMA